MDRQDNVVIDQQDVISESRTKTRPATAPHVDEKRVIEVVLTEPVKKKRLSVRKPKCETESATAPAEKDVKALESRAEKIREHDQSILKSQKSSMATALAAGEALLWGKQELKRLGITKKFQEWIEVDCQIDYKRAYNYMKLLQASLKDPTIKELGLTEAYLKLHLVTRKEKTGAREVGKPKTSNTGAPKLNENSAEQSQSSNNTPNGGTGATVVAQRRRLGALEVERHDDVYLLEIDTKEKWQDSLLDAISDVENFKAVLADGGLLLKLKE